MINKAGAWRYRVDKRSAAGRLELTYWKGCQCTSKKMELQVPRDVTEAQYIAGIFEKL